MKKNQRAHKRYDVNWNGRVLLASGDIVSTKVLNVSAGGVAISFSSALTVGSEMRIEFLAEYEAIDARIRAKISVVHNTVLANNRGAMVGVRFDYMELNDIHKLNNILRLLETEGNCRYVPPETFNALDAKDAF